MKNKFLLFCLLSALVHLFDQSALSQNLRTPGLLPENSTENISATTINFDDFLFPQVDNSYPISPNRYAGVSFYGPGYYTQTWLTHLRSWSYPNSLV